MPPRTDKFKSRSAGAAEHEKGASVDLKGPVAKEPQNPLVQKALGGKQKPRGKTILGRKKFGVKASTGVKPRVRPSVQALRELKRLDKSTDLILDKPSFSKLVKEIAWDIKDGVRFQR